MTGSGGWARQGRPEARETPEGAKGRPDARRVAPGRQRPDQFEAGWFGDALASSRGGWIVHAGDEAMEPISEGIIRSNGGAHERNRRAWGVFTLSVAGAGAFFAFLNGTFVGSASSAALNGDAAWRSSLAAEVRQAVSVPSDYATVQAAIDASADGATTTQRLCSLSRSSSSTTNPSTLVK